MASITRQAVESEATAPKAGGGVRVIRVFAALCGLRCAVVEEVDLDAGNGVVVHARPHGEGTGSLRGLRPPLARL